MEAKQPDVVLVDPKQNYRQVLVHNRVALHYEAGLALELVKLAMTAPATPVPAMTSPPGEQQYRLLSEREIVQRAFTLAELTYKEIYARGWAQQIPGWSELKLDDRAVGFAQGGA